MRTSRRRPRSALGALKIITGATSDGLGLMEEATIAAVNGELSPFVTGVTYCSMIAACRDLTDYTRASEWTEATERWCERQSVSGFPGICRVHRAEVMALGGSWERAEAELRQATTELAAYNAVPPMADGYYALGELQLRMGDLEMAEQSLREAHGLGRTPQPALARIAARPGQRPGRGHGDPLVARRAHLGPARPAPVAPRPGRDRDRRERRRDRAGGRRGARPADRRLRLAGPPGHPPRGSRAGPARGRRRR